VLFDAYADTVSALAGAADEAATLRAFELMLLRELGWLPELASATLTTQPLQPGQHYTLHAEAGLTAHAEGLPGSTWVGLEAALVHAAAAGDGSALRDACAPVASALRVPLRSLLHYHLGHARLHTRQVWQGVQRLAQTP
jgi:DNA repair protein RecO (recombination protein O)